MQPAVINVPSATPVEQERQIVQSKSLCSCPWRGRKVKKICLMGAAIEAGIAVALLIPGGILDNQTVMLIGVGFAILAFTQGLASFQACLPKDGSADIALD